MCFEYVVSKSEYKIPLCYRQHFQCLYDLELIVDGVMVSMQVDSQMKLLQNSWSELLMLNLLYLQMCHDRSDVLLLVSN